MNDKHEAFVELLAKLANDMETTLKTYTGERLPFVIALSSDTKIHYISNLDRDNGIQMLGALVGDWLSEREAAPTNPMVN